MESVKDCDTCKHYRQGEFPDECRVCVSETPRGTAQLPGWEPKNNGNYIVSCYNCQYYRNPVASICGPCMGGTANGWTRIVETKKSHDPVSSPSHYMLFPDLESIEAIKVLLTEEEFRGFLKGNVLKYRLRAGKKGESDEKTLEDIRKAGQYHTFLMEFVNGC